MCNYLYACTMSWHVHPYGNIICIMPYHAMASKILFVLLSLISRGSHRDNGLAILFSHTRAPDGACAERVVSRYCF